MRTVVGVALVTVCLGLAGCSLFGKKQAARKDNPKPFLGSDSATADRRDANASSPMPRDNNGPLPGANGVLAGRVVVEATGRPIKASILIKNLDREDAKGADLDFATDDSGYFFIPRLNANEHYELIVRANDNGELISRVAYATPPNLTLFIQLDKRFTTASTPPLPDMPKLRDKKAAAADTESVQGHNKPAVSIDPPAPLPDQGAPQGANQPDTPTMASPANIADGGFHRLTPPPVPVEIPSPPPAPGPSQWENMPEQRPPTRTVPSGSVRLPNIATPVPSCGLYGNRLDNFALYDLDGKVWEYKRDRRGRLTLLDFWYHSCHYCLLDIHRLVELQRDYAPYGLEIVSIACETGTIEEQRNYVRAVRLRYGINYRTLLSGGPACPVVGQFQVDHFPLLVLIDQDGTIIWRSPRDGMDESAHYALRKLINDRLVTRQMQP